MLRIQCPQCAKALGIQESQVGAMARCPACGNKFRIPGPARKPAPEKKQRPAPAVKAPAPEEEAGGYEVVGEKAPADGGFEVVEEEGVDEAAPPKPRPRKPVPDDDADEPEEDEAEEAPRRKKKKKKKARAKDIPVGQLLPWMSNAVFGIIAAFVGLILTVGCCGFFGYQYWWKEKQAAVEDTETAVAALKTKGAEIQRDESQPGKPVIGVNMSGDTFTGADLKHLRGFTQLKKLSLAHVPVKDAAVSNLKGLTSLESLDLSFTDITDAALDDIADLKNLQELNLAKTLVSDGGLKKLYGLTNLKKLYLVESHANGAGIAAAIPGLEVISR
jgi:predicted  nucleic acid-binding Zn-ribbon protein